MDSRDFKSLRWIQLLAVVGLVVVAVAYVVSAGKSARPMQIAISEPGPTLLPTVR
jgi:hypothetical protein